MLSLAIFVGWLIIWIFAIVLISRPFTAILKRLDFCFAHSEPVPNSTKNKENECHTTHSSTYDHRCVVLFLNNSFKWCLIVLGIRFCFLTCIVESSIYFSFKLIQCYANLIFASFWKSSIIWCWNELNIFPIFKLQISQVICLIGHSNHQEPRVPTNSIGDTNFWLLVISENALGWVCSCLTFVDPDIYVVLLVESEGESWWFF